MDKKREILLEKLFLGPAGRSRIKKRCSYCNVLSSEVEKKRQLLDTETYHSDNEATQRTQKEGEKKKRVKR